MMTITAKTQILEDGGYVYNFGREVYVNRQARKVFSREFVEDHTEEILAAKVEEPVTATATGNWHFYFNDPPSDGVKRALSAILG